MHSARSSANCRVMRSAFPSSSCLDAPNVGSSYSFWTVGPKLIGPRSPCHASACGSQACQAMPKALGVGSSYPFGYSVGSQRCTKMLTHNRAQSFFQQNCPTSTAPGVLLRLFVWGVDRQILHPWPMTIFLTASFPMNYAKKSCLRFCK